MADAVAGEVALAAQYNKVTNNVRDLHSRLTTAESKYHTVRRNDATTAVSAGTNTKVPFDTSVNAGSGITYSSGSQGFTFSNSGLYLATTSIRTDMVSELYLWLALTSSATTDYGKDASSGVLNCSTSALLRVTAGQEWSVWMWSSTAGNLAREGGSGQAPYVEFEFIRPL